MPGGQDNCASVAIIKASMYKYGIGKVVACRPRPNGIHVTLKNGQELDLSSTELAAARAADGFVHGDQADPVAHMMKLRRYRFKPKYYFILQ